MADTTRHHPDLPSAFGIKPTPLRYRPPSVARQGVYFAPEGSRPSDGAPVPDDPRNWLLTAA